MSELEIARLKEWRSKLLAMKPGTTLNMKGDELYEIIDTLLRKLGR